MILQKFARTLPPAERFQYLRAKQAITIAGPAAECLIAQLTLVLRELRHAIDLPEDLGQEVDHTLEMVRTYQQEARPWQDNG